MRDRFLEIHFSSSRGRIAKSVKLSLFYIIVMLPVLLSGFIFLLVSTIIYFSYPEISSQDQIDDYIKNKFMPDSLIISTPINFINPISKNHFYVSQGLEGDHKGIDIVAEKGSNVHASYAGRVIHSGHDNIYGKIIVLAHKNNFYTFYGHLDSIFVKKHNFVKNNQIMGLVGETGKTSGPQLHFEIWNDLETKDPRLLINELKERDVTE